ncbi:uncharacterized protein LOC134269273 [Saccostrea cucullata]|uniref:uncharacterized protein LOC134269273 n=1 Tax=Saccostrea cuccullata TaxID=36930 RepID=UPI002ED0EC96
MSLVSEDKTNAALAFSLLLGPCTDQLRDVLRRKIPTKRFAAISKEKRHIIQPLLNVDNSNLIFPKNCEYKGNYVDFDISLLYILLRNICDLPPPRKGWNKPPDAADNSVSASIERIHLARNNICHHSNFSLSSTELEEWCSNVRVAIKELDSFLDNNDIYVKKVDDMCTKDPNLEMVPIYEQQYSKLLKERESIQGAEIAESLKEIKDMLYGKQSASMDSNPCVPKISFTGLEIEGEHLKMKYRICPSNITSITFRKGENELLMSERYTKQKNGEELTFIIMNISEEDQGHYHCFLSNTFGNAEHKMELRSPMIRGFGVSVKETAVHIEYSIEIPEQCKNITSVRWLKKDMQLSCGGRYLGGGLHDPSLVIPNADTNDAGKWTLITKNIFGKDEKIFYLEPPTMRVKAKEEAENIILISSIQLADTPMMSSNLSWKKDECAIGNESTILFNTFGSPSSTIRLPTANTQGTYECILNHPLGRVISKISLEKPQVEMNDFRRINEDLRIEFFINEWESSQELLSVMWRKDGVLLDLESNKYQSSIGSKSSFTIKKLESLDKGKYELTVTSPFGNTTEYREIDSTFLMPAEEQSLLCYLLLQKTFQSKYQRTLVRKQTYKLAWQFCAFGSPTDECLDSLGTAIEQHQSQWSEFLLWKDVISPTSVESAFQAFGKRKHFVNFFLHNADAENANRFCRSSSYKVKVDEICCFLDPSQFETLVDRVKFSILGNPSVTDTTVHGILERKLDLPRGVLQLGFGGVQQYLRDLEQREHTIFHARCMLVGCEGVGKTTLLHRLMGEKKPVTEPTRGIDVRTNLFAVQNNDLQVLEDKQYPGLVSKLGIQEKLGNQQMGDKNIDVKPKVLNKDQKEEKKNLDKDQHFTKHIKRDVKESPQNEKVIEDVEEDKEEKVEEEDKIKKKGSERIAKKMIINETNERFPSCESDHGIKIENKAMEECPNSNERNTTDNTLKTLSSCFNLDEVSEVISFFDFAGQFSYYACHSVYFGPSDMYIYVQDIQKSFKEVVEKDIKKVRKTGTASFSKWTYGDFTEYWLRSIFTHTIGVPKTVDREKQTKGKIVPLIIVATHTEKKSREEIEDYFRNFRDSVPSFSYYIDYRRAFGSGFTETVDDLKKCILEVAATLPTWGKKIPWSWFFLQTIIQKHMSEKIILVSEIFKECKSVFLDLADLKVPLTFLHNIGQVLYYAEDELQKYVVVDVQWFVDAFKNIITDESHARLDTPQDLYQEWKRFNDTGILFHTLIINIWERKEKGSEYIKNKALILLFMKKLNLISTIQDTGSKRDKEEMWYVPCMNKMEFPENEFEHIQKSSSLCFKFEYIPLYLFHQLIAACSNSLKWEIYRMKSLCIYENSALFKVCGNKVLVGMHLNDIIAVQVLDSKNVDAFFFVEIRKHLTNTIQSLIKNISMEPFEVGFSCNKEVLGRQQGGTFHFVGESMFIGDRIHCSECGFGHEVDVNEISWIWKIPDSFDFQGERSSSTRPEYFKTPIKGISVTVATGKSFTMKVDVILTFAGSNLQVNHAMLEKAFGKYDVEEINQNIVKDYHFGISLGQVADISTGTLPCTRLFIGAMPIYSAKIFQKVLINCLHIATGKGLKYLCISCLEFKTQFASAVQNALQAISQYDTILLGTTVETIYIFVPEENAQIYNDIQKIIKDFTVSAAEFSMSSETSKNRSSSFFTSMKKIISNLRNKDEEDEGEVAIWTLPQVKTGRQEYEFSIDGICVCLHKGDITHIKTDAIVNSTNSEFNLRLGQVSKKILEKCGKTLEKECSKKESEIRNKKVVETLGYGLDVKYIIHVACPLTVSEWKKRLQAVFQKANDLKCSSIALPVVGTGNALITYSVETMCEAIMVSLSYFRNSNDNPTLQDVKIVIFETEKFEKVHKLLLQVVKRTQSN